MINKSNQMGISTQISGKKTAVSPIKNSLLVASSPIYSCQLMGNGCAKPIDINGESTIEQPCWLHLDFTNPQTIDWINTTTLLPKLVKEALIKPNQISKETRFDNGVLIVLKGVNLTPKSLSDPIVSFRFYITNNLIISTRYQRIDSIGSLIENIDKGIGPIDVADWLIQISELIMDQVNLSFESIHSKIVKLEDHVLNKQILSYKEIGRVRKHLFTLRRLLAPQRDIFVRISTERISWIDDNDRQHLTNISNQQSHYINDIDSCLLRLGSLMEQITGFLAESTNKRIYLMTLFTLIFMPTTFLASLFGVNLAGIPFSQSEWAFGIFFGMVIFMSIIFIFWLKFKKWM